MIGTINKIDPLKESKTENAYKRVYIILEDNTFAWTDLVPTYRNYRRWQPVLVSGVGTEVEGLEWRMKGVSIDADSKVLIIPKEIQPEPPAEERDMVFNAISGFTDEQREFVRKKLGIK